MITKNYFQLFYCTQGNLQLNHSLAAKVSNPFNIFEIAITANNAKSVCALTLMSVS